MAAKKIDWTLACRLADAVLEHGVTGAPLPPRAYRDACELIKQSKGESRGRRANPKTNRLIEYIDAQRERGLSLNKALEKAASMMIPKAHGETEKVPLFGTYETIEKAYRRRKAKKKGLK